MFTILRSFHDIAQYVFETNCCGDHSPQYAKRTAYILTVEGRALAFGNAENTIQENRKYYLARHLEANIMYFKYQIFR